MQTTRSLKQLITIFLGCVSTTALAKDYIAPAMVNIPAGEFIMGTNSSGSNAKPAHKVSVEAFQMAKYPVTVAEFRLFVEDTGFEIASDCKDKLDHNWLSSPTDVGTARWDNNRYLKSEYQPVNCMNYREAKAYADWISEKTGKSYRLPTEQEFEYAEKGNTTSRYFWGDDPNMTQACHYGNFADHAGEYFASSQVGASYVGFIGHANCDDGEPYISMVGIYRPNPFGLYDMVGNIFHLLGSCYYDGYQARTEEEMDINKCETIAHRGETWHYIPQPHADRGSYKKEGWSPSSLAGFRLALSGHNNDVDATTARFEQSLAKAQQKHLATRAVIPKAPEHAELINIKDDLFKLTWQPNRDERVTGYDIYQSKSAYSHLLGGFYQEHYRLIKTVKANIHAVDVKLPNNEGSFRVVAKTDTITSLASNAAVSYQPKTLVLPGRINMQESNALEDLYLVHRLKTEEKSELYYISAFNHLYAQPKVSATFNVTVKKSGWYNVRYNAFSDLEGVFFTVWQGNKLAGEVKYKENSTEEDKKQNKVYLEQGDHQLEISLKREGFDRWALGWIDFTQVKS